MERLEKYSVFKKIIKYVIDLLIVIFFLVTLLLIFQNLNSSSQKIELNDFQSCDFNKYQFSSDDKAVFVGEDIPIISKVKNLNCLSKAVRVDLMTDESSSNIILMGGDIVICFI